MLPCVVYLNRNVFALITVNLGRRGVGVLDSLSGGLPARVEDYRAPLGKATSDCFSKVYEKLVGWFIFCLKKN